MIEFMIKQFVKAVILQENQAPARPNVYRRTPFVLLVPPTTMMDPLVAPQNAVLVLNAVSMVNKFQLNASFEYAI